MLTDQQAPAAAPGRARRSSRRAVVGVGAAGLVLVGTALGILLLGYVPLPSFESLAESPDPSLAGTVAYIRGDRDQACVAAVPAAGGEPRELYCHPYGPGELAWTADGHVAVMTWEEPGGSLLVVLDATSGEVVGEIPWDRTGPEPATDWARERTERADGARLVTAAASAGRATVSVRPPGGPARTLIDVEGPRDYRFTAAQWSPDGRWVLASDSRGRLVIVGADGEPGPRLLVASAREVWSAAQAAWFMPGHPAYTIDPAAWQGGAGGP